MQKVMRYILQVLPGLCLVLSLPLHASESVRGLTGNELPLQISGWKHITFDGIEPTRYENEGTDLLATVKGSSSFLLLPFDSIRSVKKLSLEWKGAPVPGVKDAAHESSKKGDDAALRVGMLVAGEAPSVPFFAPAWIKLVAGALKHPSEELVYLHPAARHAPGASWKSPYASSIRNQAIASRDLTEGWQLATFEAPQPLRLVGVWIMADGDNTQSNFATRLRSLKIE